LQNVGLFIDQVKKIDHVDLFLSQLRYGYRAYAL